MSNADFPENNLPRVGTDSSGLPLSESEAGEEGQKAPRRKGVGPGKEDKKWSSSAQEELNKFKGVPVVGGLPWRTQYLIAVVVLALSVIALMGMGASKSNGGGASPAVMALREASQHIVAQAARSGSGQGINAEVLKAAVENGSKAAAATGEVNAWNPLKEDAGAVLARGEALGPVFASGLNAKNSLDQSLLKSAGVWAQIQQEGSAGTIEATALAQVLGSFRSIAAQLEGLSLGGPVSDRLAEDVAVINAGFAAFRSSPMMAQDSYLTRAWREAASAWGAAGPELERLQASQAAVNQRSISLAGVTEHALALEKTLSAKERALVVRSSGGGWLWLPGLIALASLGLLVWVAWKQQRWQVLSTQAAEEQNDEALLALMEDIQGIGQGDLTARVRVSPLPVGTLGDTLNQAVEQLRRLVLAVRKAVDENKSIVWQASESSGVLIDSQRQRVNSLETNSQDILRLIETVVTVVAQSRQAKAVAEQAQNAALVGQSSITRSLERTSEIRDRVNEAASRTQRLVSSSNEIANIAESINGLSEQLGILSVQAALHAAKAGDGGRGFLIVAQEIEKLADAAGANARHVTALVETELSDLEALASSMHNASDGVDEGIRFTDSSNEAWREVGELLNELGKIVADLRENTLTQESIATVLDERTRGELTGLNRASQDAQNAAENIRKLVDSVQSMDATVSKVKA